MNLKTKRTMTMNRLALTLTLTLLLAGTASSVGMAAGVNPSAPRALLHEPVGPLHVHTDPDWLEENARRAVASGEWAKRRKQNQKNLETQAAAPRAAFRLPKAVEPTLRRLATVAAVNPKVAAEVGSAYQGFRRTYLFIDADDPAQLAWAKRELARLGRAAPRNVADLQAMPSSDLHAAFSGPGAGDRTRLVLTAGRVDVAGKALKEELHRLSERPMFDQSGQMVRALDLRALPSKAVLTLTEARVETYLLDAEGNVVPDAPRRLPDGVVGGAVR